MKLRILSVTFFSFFAFSCAKFFNGHDFVMDFLKNLSFFYSLLMHSTGSLLKMKGICCTGKFDTK